MRAVLEGSEVPSASNGYPEFWSMISDGSADAATQPARIMVVY